MFYVLCGTTKVANDRAGHRDSEGGGAQVKARSRSTFEPRITRRSRRENKIEIRATNRLTNMGVFLLRPKELAYLYTSQGLRQEIFLLYQINPI